MWNTPRTRGHRHVLSLGHYAAAFYHFLVFIFEWLNAFPALSNSSALHPPCSSRTDRLVQQVSTPAEISQQADHNPSRCLRFMGQARAPQTSATPAPQMWNRAT